MCFYFTSFQWSCSLDYEKAHSKPDIDKYVEERSQEAKAVLSEITEFSDIQMSLAIDLMAHEYQHQGQLIRYIYANKINMPNSWKEFWHLN